MIKIISLLYVIFLIKSSTLSEITIENMYTIFAMLKIMMQRLARKWLQLEIKEDNGFVMS